MQEPIPDSDIPARFHRLAERCFEGTLTDDEAMELMELQKNDPELRRWFFRQFGTDYTLRLLKKVRSETLLSPPWMRKQPTDDLSGLFSGIDQATIEELLQSVRLAQERKAAEAAMAAQEKSKRVSKHRPLHPARQDRKKSLLPWLLLLMLVGFIAAVYFELHPYSRSPVKREPASLARITALADPVFEEDAPILKLDQRLFDETIRLASGMMELELENGVRIALEGPATFNLQSAMTCFCRRGLVSVEVPKGAEGFEVRTPTMNIRDLGTEFVVNVSETESTVHVITGQVAVNRLNDLWQTVDEGIAIVAKAGNIATQIPARRSLYFSKPRIFRLFENYENRCRESLERKHSHLADDPSLLLHLDLASHSKSEELTREKGVVGVIGTRIVPGRRSRQSAVAFQQGKDVMRLSAPVRTQSFTLIASVYLHDFSQTSNVLFSVGDLGKDALHWQVNQMGELQLLLGEQDRDGLTDYSSPSVVSPWQTRVWLTLATTVDGNKREIVHYLDGKTVATMPWKEPLSFDFAEAELGNRRRTDRAPTDRFFNGKIDEFILLNRVATPEEILTLSNPLFEEK